MSEPVFKVNGLRKLFRMGSSDIEVLKDLDFEVHAGEIVAVIGASGSGKTTFLNSLGGLDTPNAGRVLLQGTDLYALSPARRAVLRATRIGFVFQAYHLLPELDALENIMLPARNSSWRLPRFFGNPGSFFNVPRKETPLQRAATLLDAVGLSDRREHLPGELSGGEQQRVALARALMNNPDVVLADEPTGNLDARTGGQVLEYLMALVRGSNKTMVMVTHNLEVTRMADRVLEFRNGHLEQTAK